MAAIGKPIKVWEVPAPQEISAPKDLPFEVNQPEKEPVPVKV